MWFFKKRNRIANAYIQDKRTKNLSCTLTKFGIEHYIKGGFIEGNEVWLIISPNGSSKIHYGVRVVDDLNQINDKNEIAIPIHRKK